jgi:hypothetical protein
MQNILILNCKWKKGKIVLGENTNFISNLISQNMAGSRLECVARC